MQSQAWPSFVRHLVYLFYAFVALSSAPRIVSADDEQEFTLAGQVIDSSGRSSAGALVVACKFATDAAEGMQAKTDAEGKFRFRVTATPKALDAMNIEVKSADGSEMGYASLRSEQTKLDVEALSIQLGKIKQAQAAVVDADDRPVPGATVVAKLGDRFSGRVLSTTTDEAGLATISYSDQEPIAIAFAFKDQMGLDYHLFKPAQNGVGPSYPIDKPQRFLLNGTKPIKFKVVDEQERPLEGIKIYPLTLRKTPRTSVNNYDLNASFFIRHLQTTTDAQGEATCEWFPSWQQGLVNFTASGSGEFVTSQVFVYLTKPQYIHKTTLTRMVALRGTVTGVDNLPAQGITVTAAGAAMSPNPPKTAIAKTDASGNYELLVAPNCIYMVVVTDQQWASTPQQGFAVYPNTPVEGKNFKLRKATRVFGKVESKPTIQPTPFQMFGARLFPRQRVTMKQSGISIAEVPSANLPESGRPLGVRGETNRPTISHVTFADEQGNFEFFVGDGESYELVGGTTTKFRIAGEENYKADVVLNPNTRLQPEAPKAKSPLLGLIIEDVTDQPSKDCQVTIAARDSSTRSTGSQIAWEATTDGDGKFRGERVRVGSFAHAISSNKQKATILEIKDDKNVFVMKLRSVGSASGKLVNADGKPVAGQQLACCFMVPTQNDNAIQLGGIRALPHFAVYSTTDADGNFRFEQLAPNVEYQVFAGPSLNLFKPLAAVQVDPAQHLELRSIEMK